MQLKSIWPHFRDAAIGVIILAVIFPGLGLVKVPIMLIAYALPIIVGGLNIILLAAVAIMLAIAARWRRPGLALGPVLFAAIWISAGIAQRIAIERSEDPGLADRSVPADVRQIRTLIVEQQGIGSWHIMLLANGLIDRYVHVDPGDSRGVGRGIIAYTLRRGDQCSANDREGATLLARAGRTDECVHAEKTDSIPDGVIVRMQYFGYVHAIGCCHRGTISQRTAGAETVRATWSFGTRVVLSIIPLFGPSAFAQTVPLWSIGRGPSQRVEIGGPEFRHEHLVAAIYGVDLRAPIKPAVVSEAQLAQRAVALTKETGPSRFAALDIALSLQDQKFVNDELLGVVAEFVHNGTLTRDRVTRFWSRLSLENRRTFLDRVFARLQDPTVGFDLSTAEVSLLLGMQFADLRQQAEDIFAKRRDLKPWQYELALRMVGNLRYGYRTPEYNAEQRRLFETLRDDQTEGFARRAIGFKRVYLIPNDEERTFFARQLDRVPDQLLEQFLRRTGWHHHRDEKTLSDATRDYRQRALARIEIVGDDLLRRNLRDTFGPHRLNQI